MSKALYRKYRSKSLSEIVGQEHITKTLQNALKTGKISHAYLFTGPRGVGKTSIARILAHEINGLPYTDESMHLDIIEIDAASNRRIDEIRDLREKVHIAPTSAKYKVYIIDEVHMLTKEAFNALLKTLEEPPAHVVFILATTELHKLPETIVSRTQRFTFKSIDEAEAIKHLRTIAEAEGMHVEDDALRLLAQHGGGSFRDSISLLDQVGNSKKSISRTDAERLVGVAASHHVQTLLDTVTMGTPADILTSLDKLTEDGISATQAAKQLAAAIRGEIIAGKTTPAHVDLLHDLLQVNASTEPAGQLEVALLRAHYSSAEGKEQRVEGREDKFDAQTSPKPETEQPEAETPHQEQPEAAGEASDVPPDDMTVFREISSPQSSVLSPAAVGTADWWQAVLSRIKSVNNTLYGVLRMAEPHLDGDTLNLAFKFKLHAKKISEADVQAKLHEAISSVTGQAYQIIASIDKDIDFNTPIPEAAVDIAAPEPKQSAADPTHLDSVKNIFGGGEVLES